MAKNNDPMREMIPFDYVKFKESARSIAMRRGAMQPQWEDVWQAFALDPKGGDILRDMGIDTAELVYDLAYSALYGRPSRLGAYEPTAQEHLSERNRLLAELHEDLDLFINIQQQNLNEELREGAPANASLRDDFNAFIDYIEASDRPDRAVKKVQLLELLGETYLNERRLTHATRHHNPHVDALIRFKEFIEGRQRAAGLARDPFEQIEQVLSVNSAELRAADRALINPMRILDIMQQLGDDFIHYVQARDGLPVEEDYQPDYRMLPREICRLGLQAHALAHDERDASIHPMHLARILLDNPSIQSGLRELLIHEMKAEKAAQGAPKPDEDLSPLESAELSERMAETLQIIRQMTQPKASIAERFRKRITVSDDTVAALRALETKRTTPSDTPAVVQLFGELVKQPDVAVLLTEAGLKPETVQNWDKVQDAYYTQRSILRKKDKKSAADQDDLSRFKVDDETLEALIKAYGRDLTRAASQGRLDPVIGREDVVSQVQEILLRKGKRNAVLLGEAGVGKTAVAEAFAQQVVNGNVPQKLLGARLIELDMAAMNAGARFRGDFEERLKGIVDGVAERNASGRFPPIVLFIDELHAAMNTGGASGSPGAGEILKPSLARGDLLSIGSTTEREYRQHIAKDAALARRFEPVIVHEPNLADTVKILRGVLPGMQAHHGIEIPEALLDELARLCRRYVEGYSPDKDISVLDMACAKAARHGQSILAREQLLESVAQKGRLPLDFLMRDDNEKALALPKTLREQVLAQEPATDAVAGAVIKAKAGLQDPNKPIASFVFKGPTGVGKTETAKALAIHEFGSADALVRIDMGEYMEPHSVSRLIGSPPGYVGYEEEGQLTKAISRRPHSVILFDEIEKAHPKVFDALLALLDDGRLTDGQGRTVDFRNTIIIMTTNHPDPKKLFRPEMYNRIDEVIGYQALPKAIIHKLVERQIEKLESRMQEQFGCDLVLSDHAKEQLADKGYQPELGARPLNRAVDKYLTGPLAPWLLAHQQEVKGQTVMIDDIERFAPTLSNGRKEQPSVSGVQEASHDGAVQAVPSGKKSKS